MIMNADIKIIGEDEVAVSGVIGIPNLCYEYTGVSWFNHITPPQDGLQEVIVNVSRVKGTEENYCLPQYRTHGFEISHKTQNWFRGVHYKSKDGTSLHKLLFAKNDGDDLTGSASFYVRGMNTVNDKVFIKVDYSGGCAEHTFQLRYDGYDEDKRLIYFVLSQDDNGDTCKAIMSEMLEFDYSGVPAPDFTQHGTFRLALRNFEGVQPAIISGLRLDNPAIIDKRSPLQENR
jgi:hypothetical protein